MSEYTRERIEAVMRAKGYAFFTEGDYNLNLLAVLDFGHMLGRDFHFLDKLQKAQTFGIGKDRFLHLVLET